MRVYQRAFVYSHDFLAIFREENSRFGAMWASRLFSAIAELLLFSYGTCIVLYTHRYNRLNYRTTTVRCSMYIHVTLK